MSEDVNVQGFPQWLSQIMGIPLVTAQIVSGIVILVLFTFPFIVLTKGRDLLLLMIVGFTSLLFVTALGWIPSSIIILAVIGVAAMVAVTFKKWVT